MKITAQVEYGLRILLRIAAFHEKGGLTIRQISKAEGISKNYAAKFTRMLRMKGLIISTRGKTGGYVLAKPAAEITINNILMSLDGLFFDKEFCRAHTGIMKKCTHSCDCSLRPLWSTIQHLLNLLFDRITLADFAKKEHQCLSVLQKIIVENSKELY